MSSRRTVGRNRLTEPVADSSGEIFNSEDYASEEHSHQFEQEIKTLTLKTDWQNYDPGNHDSLGIFKIGNYVQFVGIIAATVTSPSNDICDVPSEFLPAISKLPYTFVTNCNNSVLGSTGIRLELETDGNLRKFGVSLGVILSLQMERIRYALK